MKITKQILEKAMAVQIQIEALQKQLDVILNGGETVVSKPVKRKLSAQARKNIADGQRARREKEAKAKVEVA